MVYGGAGSHSYCIEVDRVTDNALLLPRVVLLGNWLATDASTVWSPSGFRLPDAALSEVDARWQQALSVRTRRLFDGAMCRMEGFAIAGGQISVHVSPTSYRLFWGTNVSHPEWAETYGPSAMANPIGVSPALHTSDGFLLFGRRNATVAYYPDRVHPFAGTVEPGVGAVTPGAPGPDLFAEVRRELAEELRLADALLGAMRLLGVIEEPRLRQCEFIFGVDCRLSWTALERQLDPAEHRGVVAVPARPTDVATAVCDPVLTPVAVSTLLLWGRSAFGEPWFEHSSERVLDRADARPSA
jgi:hypothetical protein